MTENKLPGRNPYPAWLVYTAAEHVRNPRYDAWRREHRRKQGQCIFCNQMASPGFKRCPEHLQYGRARRQKLPRCPNTLMISVSASA